MLNPETANYQNFINVDSTTPIIDLKPAVENLFQGAKNFLEDIKANAQQNQNDPLRVAGGSLEYKPPPIIDLSPLLDGVVEKAKNAWQDIKANARQNQSVYDILNPTLEEQNYQSVATQVYPTSDIPDIFSSKEASENSIIHEELAEKTKQISKLELEDKKKEEKISELEARIEKLEKNPFSKWFPRALDDSKDERVF